MPPETGDEVLDQRGLADARFAGDPDHRALPAAGLLPRLLQPGDGVGAADERRRWLRARRRRRGGDGRCRWRGGRHRDEAVAAPRHGLDEARLARVVAERRAQVADGGLEHRFGDELVAPHRVEQRVLRQQRARLARQRAQQAEGRGCERDGLAVGAAARHSPRRVRTRRSGSEQDSRWADERATRCVVREDLNELSPGRLRSPVVAGARAVVN